MKLQEVIFGMFGLKRPIRTVLAPAEACNRMYNALRKLYSAIVNMRNERNAWKRIEKFHAIFEADDLVDDAYAILRYSILKNLLLHLENSSNLAKKDPNYLARTVESAVTAKTLFESSRKSEHESMRKCNFLRSQSHHLIRVAKRREGELRRLLKQKMGEIQKQQLKAISKEEFKKQVKVVTRGKEKKEQQKASGKIIEFPGGKNIEDWYKGRNTG